MAPRRSAHQPARRQGAGDGELRRDGGLVSEASTAASQPGRSQLASHRQRRPADTGEQGEQGPESGGRTAHPNERLGPRRVGDPDRGRHRR